MKKTLLLLTLVLFSTSLFAFERNGICYAILSDSTVSVTQNPAFYVGSITIPSKVFYEGTTYKVVAIGDKAFMNGRLNVTSVTIPNSVTSIGTQAFYGCSNLTSVNIPNSIKTIGEMAFFGCRTLPSIDLNEGVVTIGRSAFANCQAFTAITIPNSITKVEASVFMGCTNLISVTLGNRVSFIGEMAFLSCDKLASINIPNSLDSVGENVFSQCPNLTIPLYNEHLFVHLPHMYRGAYIIPDGITTIATNAFKNDSCLTSITIPNSVVKIGVLPFSACQSLEEIKVAEGNPIFHSEGNCLIETSSKTLLAGCKNSIIPTDGSVTSIGNWAFMDNSNLISIAIPNTITTIGNLAFTGCSQLSSIILPKSLENIGVHAYSFCKSLSSITIPNSVMTIGDNAFANCSNLTSAIIGNSVTTIGERAFNGCSNLTSVTIGESVATIGNRAFLVCSSLTEITCRASVPPSIESQTFDETSYTLPLYVPTESVEDYKAAEYWNEFTNIQAISGSTAGLETLYDNVSTETRKVFENGIIYILRNGEKYTIEGRKVI